MSRECDLIRYQLREIPFYSHHLTNPASAGIARSLGLPIAFEDVVYA